MNPFETLRDAVGWLTAHADGDATVRLSFQTAATWSWLCGRTAVFTRTSTTSIVEPHLCHWVEVQTL